MKEVILYGRDGCCLSDEALYVLAKHDDGLWAGLHDSPLLGQLTEEQCERALLATDNLERWHRLKDRLPIAGLVNRVLADSGYDAATQFEFLGERKLANLWKLVDMARTFDRSGLFGLADFIAHLVELVRSQPREVGTREIARAFGLKNADRTELRRLLRSLAEDGIVSRDSKKRIHVAGALPAIIEADITAQGLALRIASRNGSR